MMKVPISAVLEDDLINLRGDECVDPHGSDPVFSATLRVLEKYSGDPKDADRFRVWGVVYATQIVTHDDTGTILIVSPGNGARATLVYFPDDQHEIELVAEDDDDDAEEDDDVAC